MKHTFLFDEDPEEEECADYYDKNNILSSLSLLFLFRSFDDFMCVCVSECDSVRQPIKIDAVPVVVSVIHPERDKRREK